MAVDVPAAPDERSLLHHLTGASFRVGVADGKWSLCGCSVHQSSEAAAVAWPYAFFAVAAAPRDHGPRTFTLRLELRGFPSTAPAGQPWHCATSQVLGPELLPKGGQAGEVFRSDWQGGALYAPWDRLALAHNDWAAKYPMSAWHTGRNIAFYLENVWQILNADDYSGI
jgi:hypothetical protein